KQAIASVAAKGREFLAGLIDPSLDLLPEYRGAQVYWLVHDNYLAAKILSGSHPEMAGKSTQALRRHGGNETGKDGIVFGGAKQPLPFRQYRLAEVKRIGDKVLKTEIVEGSPFVGWKSYADLLFLAAIALADDDPKQARQLCETGVAMWDER